jgi:hypothetical protein
MSLKLFMPDIILNIQKELADDCEHELKLNNFILYNTIHIDGFNYICNSIVTIDGIMYDNYFYMIGNLMIIEHQLPNIKLPKFDGNIYRISCTDYSPYDLHQFINIYP